MPEPEEDFLSRDKPKELTKTRRLVGGLMGAGLGEAITLMRKGSHKDVAGILAPLLGGFVGAAEGPEKVVKNIAPMVTGAASAVRLSPLLANADPALAGTLRIGTAVGGYTGSKEFLGRMYDMADKPDKYDSDEYSRKLVKGLVGRTTPEERRKVSEALAKTAEMYPSQPYSQPYVQPYGYQQPMSYPMPQQQAESDPNKTGWISRGVGALGGGLAGYLLGKYTGTGAMPAVGGAVLGGMMGHKALPGIVAGGAMGALGHGLMGSVPAGGSVYQGVNALGQMATGQNLGLMGMAGMGALTGGYLSKHMAYPMMSGIWE